MRLSIYTSNEAQHVKRVQDSNTGNKKELTSSTFVQGWRHQGHAKLLNRDELMYTQ
jgi:hypothetical protein